MMAMTMKPPRQMIQKWSEEKKTSKKRGDGG